MSIRFGTSGWRAIIADDFTYENVRLVTKAICSYLKSNITQGENLLIVGHDSRFMGEKFASVAAGIAERKGFHVLLCENPTPTPTISHAIRNKKAVGGIN
ncbi:MAG TPA: phosphoglucomutase/phosphomannomutase family protein, partial [Pyrinomonadaceae bacterium]